MKKRVVFQRGLLFLAISVGVYWGEFLLAGQADQLCDRVLDSLGLLMVFLGFCIRIVARGHKKMDSLNGRRLVTDGLYAYIRNPMYTGTFLIGLGVTLAVFHPVAIGVFIVGYTAIYLPQIRREERLLASDFGDGYRAYCQRTPRMVPMPGRWGKFFRELFPRQGGAVLREGLGLGLVLLSMLGMQIVAGTKAGGWDGFWKEPLEFVISAGIFFLLLYFFAKEKT